MQKRLLRIVVATAIVAAIAVLVMRMAQNKVLVTNESGQEIRTLTVAAPGMAPATFRDIAPGSTRTFRFFSRGEGGIALRATLADGTVLAGKDGYVTTYVAPCTMKFAIPATGRVLFNGHLASWPGEPNESAAREERHREALKAMRVLSKKFAELATKPTADYPRFPTSPWAATTSPATRPLQP